jgi:class 3 adenylate cyclase/predicted ATPase
MDFYEVVDQVVKLLQQRGRLTYRSLKVQFKLDDATCEALKDELLFSHPVVDHEGRGVVWIGAAEAQPAPVSASLSAETSQRPTAEEEPPTQVAPLSTEHRIPEAERRQLTVMFCDLVDSTRLSSQLDPEDYREVVRAYQSVCTEVITRFDGHIAQLLGDGLLVYFGYPHAHEDDAQRAVRTGLGILAAMEDLHTRLQQDKGIQLALRVGIHTGLVVVGAMGGGGRQEQLALGETPNVAARIQGLAAPNTLVVSSTTYRLIQGYFACQDLGAQSLRGVAEPITVYQILRESGATSRLDIAQPRGLTPLVGREQEVGLLLERWEQVKAGHGHVVLLTGDAGIGKSRLVQMLKDHVADEPHVRWECRSAEYYQNTVLFPLTDLFQRILQFETRDTPAEKLGKLEQTLSQSRLPLEETVLLFAPLLSLPIPENRYPPLTLSPQRQRQKTLETVVAILLELAEQQPVLFIVEDLHWTDPSTLELLNLVLDQTPTASLLVLLTCRPYFQPAWHHRSYLTEITVNRLSHAQVEQIVTHMTDGTTFPAEVVQQIITKTDGVPLFIEELTKAILESGHLKDVNGHYELTGSLRTLTIPATLQDSLMARLDRLMTAKVIAQLGATIGRQFSYALLQAVAQLNDRTLHEELHRLVEAELLYQRGVPPQATYTFKHALIQDAAYESLLKSTRQQYHQRIAQVLEAQFPETAATQPELLAWHYTEAGLQAQALPYWHQAGQRALARSAYAEAIHHMTTGIALLTTLAETPERLQQEMDMQIALGTALMVTIGLGAPEAKHAYDRARLLCQQLDDIPKLFTVLSGLARWYMNQTEFLTAQECGEELLTLAQRLHDPARVMEAYRMLGNIVFWRGELIMARAHLEEGLALYHAHQSRVHAMLSVRDPGVEMQGFVALTLWFLGYPDQAFTSFQQALHLAQALAHPYSLAVALNMMAWLHQCRRESLLTQDRAEAVIALATEHGFAQRQAASTMLRGWALADQGRVAEGIAQIRQGLPAWQATGTAIWQPYFLALLAEACVQGGHVEEGLALLTEALAIVDRTGEGLYEAEVYRLRGVSLLRQDNPDATLVEACFQQALDVSRRQQAKSWELRAAMSLARLWQRQGKRTAARELLAPIYGWFTEGFDTVDLQEAKTLLAALV